MKKLILSLLAIGGSALAAQAAILVQPSGSGVITFPSRPAAADWASASVQQVTAADGIWGTVQNVIDGVNALDQSGVTVQPVQDTAAAANPGQNNNAVWTSGGTSYLVTRPTGNAGTVVKATLENNTGSDLNELRVMYTFGRLGIVRTEQVVGQEVFYSLTGAAGTWVHIPELSGGLTTVSTVLRSNTVTFASAWTAGSTMYFLWADDNATGGTDDGNSIDDISFAPPGSVTPLSAALNTPANGQYFTSSSINPSSVQVTATAVGTVAPTSVTFYTNNVLWFVDSAAPYSNTLSGLPPGTYTIYAMAVNAGETAFSTTNTFIIRDEFVSFSGSPISQNFDGMGATGTETPIGWYVGHSSTTVTPPITLMTVSVGDGSSGPSPAGGWNYGTSGDGDRALGTAATGTSSPSENRNVVVRIKNDTASSITAVNFLYDGESWRNYTNSQFGYTNMISLDNGGTWIVTGTSFDYLQPVGVPGPPDGLTLPGPLNGNDPANRQASVGGSFTLPSPVAPNATLYIRWFDRNEGGTDGAVAIDNFTFTATLDVFAPTVAISSPANGSAFAAAAPVTITAVPSFANPVTNVTFYNNNLSTVITNDTTSPFSITVNNLSVGNHTLFVIAQDNSGARATNTATVTITINPNVPPSVTITNPPVLPTEMLVGGNVTVGAVPADSDGSIVGVEFFVNGVRRGTNDVTSAYSMEIGNLTAGLNLISAVAIDNAGGRGTSSFSITVTNPPGATALVTNGSDWKYFDTGTDPGATWRDFGFDDTAWLTGIAELGYGDAADGRPEITVINGGVTPNFFATTYFRKKFNVANPASVSSLMLRIMKDDHAIVYLNGTKIFSDVTNEVVTFQTYVPGAVTGDGAIYEVTNNIPGSLIQAQNIIAVEVHQASAGSSDVSFDLMLFSEAAGASGPRLTITQTSPTQATIAWGADATGFTLYGGPTVPFSLPAWTTIGGPIAGAGSTTVNTTGDKFFILRNP